MKINFDTWNQNPGVDKTTTSQGAAGFYQEAKAGAYALDISGIVMDNNAYGEHGRSAKEVMQSMGVQLDNFAAHRDLMTVMSNIMSTEDFNKMMEDGFNPSKLEPEQVVTIVDHIKAEMAKSGQVVAGYNDDLSKEKLTEILGSTTRANEVEKALKASDMPINEENVSVMKETLDKAASVTELDDAGKKYMLENHLEPTVENIYRASFSAQGDGSKQSKGYFSQEMPGYYAKKADIIDWKAMEPQIAKSVEKMNLGNQTKEESMEQAKWLISRGIPVTEQTMQHLGEILSISFPLDETEVIAAGVNAMTKGNAPSEGSLIGDMESIYDKANRYVEETAAISEEAVMETVTSMEEINLKNLTAAQKRIDSGEISKERAAQLSSMVHAQASMSVHAEISIKYVHASRTLAEVQLRMTIDANIRLLKSDTAIDTMPLTELVEALRQQEESLSVSFFGKENSGEIVENTALYKNTQSILSQIPFMPAAVIGRITATAEASLTTVYTEGAALRAQYVAAGVSYETLMTAPRADLGDSIKKAFANVDDILSDMGQELSDDNRKAVRILGYNNTPITKDALEEVKETYLQVENVVKAMTPQKTLSLIREGVNPLIMSLDELETHLQQMEQSAEEEVTKYSRYLYELEKNGQITEGEREAYIGIYRLFHQIEKSDGAVVGSLMNQGAELTLGNLLTAARNRKAGKMEYTIDDNFGTLTETVQKGSSISGQIEKGVSEAKQAHAVYRDLSVEKLQQMNINEQTTLSELKDGLLKEADNADMAAKQAMFHDTKQDLEDAAGVEKAVMEALNKQDIPLSAENILAAKELFSNKGSLSKQARDYAKKLDAKTGDGASESATGKESTAKASFEAAFTEKSTGILEKFTDYESAQSAMEAWESGVTAVLEETMGEMTESVMDVRALSLCFKQVSLMSSLRKQENYEVPMEINGEMTSVNLVLVHDTQEKGTVSVTMQTERFGKAGVKFHISSNVIESYFVADSEMGKERLQTAGEAALGILQEKGMEIGKTNYVNSHSQGRKELNLLTFSQSDVDNNNKTVATKQLYEAARIFLGEMQKAFSVS